MKKFKVVWTETHSAIVEAEDEVKAKDKVMEGNFISDEGAEVDSIDAYELENENWKGGEDK